VTIALPNHVLSRAVVLTVIEVAIEVGAVEIVAPIADQGVDPAAEVVFKATDKQLENK